MDNKKAIEMLKYIKYTGNGESEYKNNAQGIAIEMAIEALKNQEAEKERIIKELEEATRIVIDDCEGMGFVVIPKKKAIEIVRGGKE